MTEFFQDGGGFIICEWPWQQGTVVGLAMTGIATVNLIINWIPMHTAKDAWKYAHTLKSTLQTKLKPTGNIE